MVLARAEARVRRHHRRRRRPRPRHRLLPRQGARHHQCRGAGKGLARRRQHRPQHHHHPLQLSLRRERGHLRPRSEAVGRALPGSELQRHVFGARRHDAGAQCARHPGAEAPHPRQPAERRRQRVPDARAGEGILPAAQHLETRALSGDGRGPAAARRHRPPRRGRLGLCARRLGARRAHHPELRGQGHQARRQRRSVRRRDDARFHRRQEGRRRRGRPLLRHHEHGRRQNAARNPTRCRRWSRSR